MIRVLSKYLIGLAGVLLVVMVLSCSDSNSLASGRANESATPISFTEENSQSLGINKFIRQWHDEELARQGGKFKSHGWWPWGMGGFDYDNDGDIDLYLSHHGAPGGRILENRLIPTGKLSFTVLDTGSNRLPGADDRPWFFDFDGDGWLDIAALSDEGFRNYVWSREGSFAGETSRPEGTFRPLSHPLQVTDVNDDGYLDLDGGRHGVYVYTPDTFSFSKVKQHSLLPPSNMPSRFLALEKHKKKQHKRNRFLKVNYFDRFANGFDTEGQQLSEIDLNHDGKQDLIIQGAGGYGAEYFGIYLLQQKSGELALNEKNLNLPSDGAPIFYGDLDGKLGADLLIAGNSSAGVFVNSADGFTRVKGDMDAFLSERGPYLHRAYAKDFDADGDADMVLSNPRKRLGAVYENLGNGKFELVMKFRGWDANPIFLADINNDGKVDVITGSGTKTAKIFLNSSISQNKGLTLFIRYKYPNPYGVDSVITVSNAATQEVISRHKARWDGLPLHIGVSAAKNVNVTIDFPDGNTQTYLELLPENRYTLTYSGDAYLGYLSPQDVDVD